MKQISKQNLKVLRSEINAALEGIAEKHNISLHAGNASFNPKNATFKLEVAVKGEGGVVMTPEAEALKTYKGIHGLKFGYNDTFTYRGEQYTVKGFKPRSTKYPVVAENAAGTSYKFPVDTVNRHF